MSSSVDVKDMHAGLVVCWGEVLWDMFPDGRRLGGAPANVAYHLAVLGANVALVTRIGDDALGHEAMAVMAAHGVDTSLVQIDAVRPTGRVDVEIAGGEPSYRLVEGCAWEDIEVTPAVERALGNAAAFCFGTLSQRINRTHFERALSLVSPGCLRVCDPNLRPKHVDMGLVRMALKASDVVKINDGEARILAECVGVEDAVAWLRNELGVGIVALTRGAFGSRLVGLSGIADHEGIAALPGGDNVGAGDAFTAVLVRLLGMGRDLETINMAANRYASYVASCRGATPAIPAELIAATLGG